MSLHVCSLLVVFHIMILVHVLCKPWPSAAKRIRFEVLSTGRQDVARQKKTCLALKGALKALN